MTYITGGKDLLTLNYLLHSLSP